MPDPEKKWRELSAPDRSRKTLAVHVRVFGDVEMCKINATWCHGFVDYLKNDAQAYKKNGEASGSKLSANTQRLYLVVLAVALNKAVEEKIITSNPLANLTKAERRIKKEKDTRCFLDVDELRKLAQTPCKGDDEYDISKAFLFATNVGLRWCDIVRLTAKDIKRDKNGNFIDIVQQKTKERVKVYLTDYALSLLPGSDDEKPLFHLPQNAAANKKVVEWAKDAGLKKHVTFHVSRHTCATVLLSAGVPIQNVADQLGHTDIKTTQIYAKIVDDARKETANVMENIMSGI